MNKVLYIKNGRRYRKARYNEFPMHPAEGLWIVTRNGDSQELIKRIAELPDDSVDLVKLYRHKQEISKLIMDWRDGKIYKEYKGRRWVPSVNSLVETIFDILSKEVTKAKPSIREE